MKNARVVVAVALVGVLAVVFGVVALMGGSEGTPSRAARTKRPARVENPVRAREPVRAALTLERYVIPTTGSPEELIVSLPQQRLNVLQTTGGETRVLLRCFDEGGAERLRHTVAWPLLLEPGYPPHIHQPLRPDVLESVRDCRLTGAGIDFHGRVRGPVPMSK